MWFTVQDAVFILLHFLPFILIFLPAATTTKYLWFTVENPVFLLVYFFSPFVSYTLFVLTTSTVALSSYLSWIIPTPNKI